MSSTRQLQLRGMDGGQGVENVSRGTDRSQQQQGQACAHSVLLYGVDYWIPLRRQVKQLNTFHHRCIQSILGISNKLQWDERITMAEVREWWRDEQLVDEKIQKRRLEWLGYRARMQDHRFPNCVLLVGASTPSLEQAMQEMEGCSQERPPADWY